MKVIELLKISRNFLEMLQESCINTNDVRYVEMYDEYNEMLRRKEKASYAASLLSRKYKISERQFYYVIKRLSVDCNFRAP